MRTGVGESGNCVGHSRVLGKVGPQVLSMKLGKGGDTLGSGPTQRAGHCVVQAGGGEQWSGWAKATSTGNNRARSSSPGLPVTQLNCS